MLPYDGLQPILSTTKAVLVIGRAQRRLCDHAAVWQIAYRTVEVSPLTKKQLRWADYKKVPVVVMDGEAYGDSTAIITRLAAELGAQQENMKKAPQSRPSRGLWPFSSSKSAADVLVGPFMEPCWNQEATIHDDSRSSADMSGGHLLICFSDLLHTGLHEGMADKSRCTSSRAHARIRAQRTCWQHAY